MTEKPLYPNPTADRWARDGWIPNCTDDYEWATQTGQYTPGAKAMPDEADPMSPWAPTERGYYRTNCGLVAYIQSFAENGLPGEGWIGSIVTVGISTWDLAGHDISGDPKYDLVTAISKQDYEQGYNHAWGEEHKRTGW